MMTPKQFVARSMGETLLQHPCKKMLEVRGKNDFAKRRPIEIRFGTLVHRVPTRFCQEASLKHFLQYFCKKYSRTDLDLGKTLRFDLAEKCPYLFSYLEFAKTHPTKSFYTELIQKSHPMIRNVLLSTLRKDLEPGFG